MGWWDDLTGETAAQAAEQAGRVSREAGATTGAAYRSGADDTYGKQQDAIAKLLGYGDQYATGTRDLAKAYDPYVATGRTSNDALNRLISDPSSVRSLPGYQFAQDEGIQALDRSAAARGRLDSGRQSKDLMRFGTGLADKTYGDQLARLMGLNQQGMVATGAQTGVIGNGLQGQLGARTSAYGGDYGSSGTIGKGMVGGANAEGQGNVAGASADLSAANSRASGTQNLLNTGLQIAGMVAAPFTGGASLGLSSLMGGLGGGGRMSNYGQTSNASGYGAGTGGLSFPMFG